MTVERPILRYHGGKWLLAPWIIRAPAEAQDENEKRQRPPTREDQGTEASHGKIR